MSFLLWRTMIGHQLQPCRSRISSQIRYLSITTKSLKQSNASNELSTASTGGRTDISTDVRPIGERIKENTKTASYLGVIALGVSVTGIMFYAIFRELFSSTSPNSVYSDALNQCINDTRVQDALGAPIKGFGEESRRRRRQHVAHGLFEREGVPCMRMHFYIQGIRNKATVHLEKRMDINKYRYLFVQLDHYPKTTIVLEDNRLEDHPSSATFDQSLKDMKF